MRAVAQISALSGWIDWKLSPMVVKEVRQGLRTKGFFIAFIVIQILLSFGVVLEFLSYDERLSRFFWWALYACFLFLMPLRGYGSVYEERKLKTLDVVQLTQLSSSQIIFGKWISLVGQSFLVASTVFPYMMLRYFSGGLNVIVEAFTLYILFVVSAGLTAITVGSSAFRYSIIRLGGAFIVIGFGMVVLMVALDNGPQAFDPETGLPWAASTKITLFVILLSYLFLNLGAKSVAQLAENHETIKRIVFLLVFLLLGHEILSGESTEFQGFGTKLWFFLALIACTDALTNPEPGIPRLFEPFANRGYSGKLAGVFFSPGWASGIFYTMLVMILWANLLVLSDRPVLLHLPLGSGRLVDNWLPAFGAWLALTAGLFLPLLIAFHVFRKHRLRLFAFYACIFSLLFLTGSSMDRVDNKSLRRFASGIPPLSLWLNEALAPDARIKDAMVEGSKLTGSFGMYYYVEEYWIEGRVVKRKSHSVSRGDLVYNWDRVAYVILPNILVILLALIMATRQLRKNLSG